MKLTPITDTFTVASQPDESEIAILGTHGTRLLINNRPEHEEPGQPDSAVEAAAAEAAGLRYRHIPVTGGSITRTDVEAFGQAVHEAGGPVVAHCRSGTRSLTLWVIGEVLGGRMSRDDVVAFGAERGFDLSGALSWLRVHS
ncbi:TIGR01244 family sulfur transferase [Methylobacterium komagatae]|uniref:TIGR01244 family sulfur transferase n=1 Tax=Methylobacterium komagatae TaxID=374425 RepID=A0ABW2BR30_9HYPH